MDATLAQVLVGLMTNAFTGVVEKSWASATSIDLEEVVREGIEEVAADGVKNLLDSEGTVEFLRSPEATTLVRLLFVSGVHQSTETTEDLRSTFVGNYQESIGSVDQAEGEEIFELIAAATEQIVGAAARTGDPEAGEALAAIRFRHLTEEIQGLKQSVEALQRPKEEDVEAYLEWEEIYRDQVRVRHGTIVPPSFDGAERVPVEDIYIETRFRRTDDPDPAELSMRRDEVVEWLDRTVVLGDPGAGKSTFALKLAYDLAGGSASLPGGALTPLIVTLKDYGAEKAAHRTSLVEWIESVVKTDYMAPAPAGAVEYLLDTGRAVLILDGLDELLDTSYRREVTADVETFAARYVAAPILVTSRRIGYSQAPLDPRRFDCVYLSELEDDQVRQYVDMWFELRKEMPPRERTAMAENFMRDSTAAAADLRRNTLILALLCNIYRGGGYIPRHRPQVYEKCAVMLFERWDRGRRIEVPLEFERHLRPALQHLAYWIYSSPALQSGVSEAALIRSTTEYLMGRRFDDPDAARQEARRFVEFCRGRAWVFTDTGTTAEGEGLYQFAHRTFLEFFTAEHLVRTNATPEELGEILRPRIRKGEWDVVAQLAFQLQDDNIDGAADQLLRDLLADTGVGPERSTALAFAARGLSFLVPRRDTCRLVAEAVAEAAYSWLLSLPRQGSSEIGWAAYEDPLDAASLAAAFRALVNLDRENLNPVAETVVSAMDATLEADGSLRSAEAALEVAVNADMATHSNLVNLKKWEEFGKRALEGMWPRLREYVGQSDRIVYDGLYFGLLEIDEAVEARSVQSLFDVCRFDLYPNNVRSSFAETLLLGALGFETRVGGEPLGAEEELGKLGLVLAETKPPWDRSGVLRSGLEEFFAPGSIDPLDTDLEGEALFGAFALLAALSEHLNDPRLLRGILDRLQASEGWPLQLSPWIAIAHGLEEATDVPLLPMSPALREKVAAWSEHQWFAVARNSHFS